MRHKLQLLYFVAIGLTIVSLVVFSLWHGGNSDSNANKSSLTNAAVSAAQCERDTDCLVGGCSNQLCLPRDQSATSYSTCEWKAEYACFAQDSCLCRQGRCQWAGSQTFAACIQKLAK